jgi:hypothetical protein
VAAHNEVLFLNMLSLLSRERPMLDPEIEPSHIGPLDPGPLNLELGVVGRLFVCLFCLSVCLSFMNIRGYEEDMKRRTGTKITKYP